MTVADDLRARLVAHPQVEVYGENASGVVLWRDRRLADQTSLIAKLPVGMASHTSIGDVSWIRQVAANPTADVETIWTHIAAAL